MNKEELKKWLEKRNYKVSGYEFWGLILKESIKKKPFYKELVVKKYLIQ